MIKAVILDFYGVIQTDEVIIWAEKQAIEHPNIRTAVDVASAKIDLDEISLDEYFEELAAAVERPADVVKEELKKEVAINQPLLEVVDQLREAGLKTAILSNDGSSLLTYLDQHGITPHFDQIFVSGEIGIMKPEAGVYQHVIQHLGVEPNEAIFFDDRQANIDGAIRAGLQAELYKSVSQVRNFLS